MVVLILIVGHDCYVKLTTQSAESVRVEPTLITNDAKVKVEEAPEKAVDRDDVIDLFSAVIWVESRSTLDDDIVKTVNGSEQARGPAQIRPIMVKDVNRIMGDTEFTLDDCFRVDKSFDAFVIYTRHYYPDGSLEDWARAWNGGPRGPDKEATVKYWELVKRRMEVQE